MTLPYSEADMKKCLGEVKSLVGHYLGQPDGPLRGVHYDEKIDAMIAIINHGYASLSAMKKSFPQLFERQSETDRDHLLDFMTESLSKVFTAKQRKHKKDLRKDLEREVLSTP